MCHESMAGESPPGACSLSPQRLPATGHVVAAWTRASFSLFWWLDNGWHPERRSGQYKWDLKKKKCWLSWLCGCNHLLWFSGNKRTQVWPLGNRTHCWKGGWFSCTSVLDCQLPVAYFSLRCHIAYCENSSCKTYSENTAFEECIAFETALHVIF